MDEDEQAEAEALLAQAAAAVADRYVQEGVFATLQTILPDLERIQEWRSAVRYAPPLPTARDGRRPSRPSDTQQLLAQTHVAAMGQGCAQPLLGRPEADRKPADGPAAGAAAG